MMRRSAILLLLGATAALGGCNALYFYESAKISLSVEARPDASQPVQGNFGGKQRAAVVSPPLDADGESASMISSFRFEREPENDSAFGPIEIHTALVTGAAALAVNTRAKARRVALAVAGAPIPSAAEQASEIVDDMSEAQRARARALLARQTMTEQEKRELGQITGLLDNVDENRALLDELRRQLEVE